MSAALGFWLADADLVTGAGLSSRAGILLLLVVFEAAAFVLLLRRAGVGGARAHVGGAPSFPSNGDALAEAAHFLRNRVQYLKMY